MARAEHTSRPIHTVRGNPQMVIAVIDIFIFCYLYFIDNPDEKEWIYRTET